MAVFPERIVLKNSTDSDTAIRAAIVSGGSDQINAGELVVGRITGGASLYTVDSVGDIVQIGSGAATIVSEYEPGLTVTDRYWRISNLVGIDDEVTSLLYVGDIHFFSEDTQALTSANLSPLLYSWNRLNVPTASIATTQLERLTDENDSVKALLRTSVETPGFNIAWDLGLPRNVAFISIASRDLENRLNGFDVEHSSDGVNWNFLKTFYWDDSEFATTGYTYGSYKATDNLSALNQGAALEDGDLWFKPSTSILSVYYNGAWVAVSGEGGSGSVRGDGGDFDAGTIDAGFAMGVYGGGDFNAGTIDYPTTDGPDGGSF